RRRNPATEEKGRRLLPGANRRSLRGRPTVGRQDPRPGGNAFRSPPGPGDRHSSRRGPTFQNGGIASLSSRDNDSVALCRRAFRQRGAAFSDPADDRQDDPAALGRHSGGLEYVLGLLPGDLVDWISLCSWNQSLAAASTTALLAFGLVAAPLPDLAVVAFAPALTTGDISFFHDPGVGSVGQNRDTLLAPA